MSARSTPPVPTVRSGWLAGLQHKIARALLDQGFHSKEHARAAVMDGRISPALTPGLGHQSYLLLCEWLSVPPQMKEPSSAEVAAAVALLERAGYEVTLQRATKDGNAGLSACYAEICRDSEGLTHIKSKQEN